MIQKHRNFIYDLKHKESNPGRPVVVSSVKRRTTNISKYVSYHLQPIVKEIQAYIKDTQDFLKKFEKIRHTSRVPSSYIRR